MKTYRSWAELDDWGSGRQLRTPHKRKSKLEWQSEIQEEMAEEEMQEVFIIENEWFLNDGEGGHCNISVHFTEEAAVDALVILANDLGVPLSGGDTSFEDGNEEIYFINRYEVNV